MRLPLSLLLPLASAGLLLGGCGAEERTVEITDVRERAVAGPPPPAGMTEARRLGFEERRSGGPTSPSGMRWTWDTPSGWEEAPLSPDREAGWRVAGNPDAEASFTLGTKDGGGLLETVNLWRTRMSLAPATAEDVAAFPRETFFGRPSAFVDLRAKEGADRLLAIVAELPVATAVLTLAGPPDVVEAERERFLALARSIRMGGRPADRPATPSTPAAPATPASSDGAGALRWTAPAGWTASSTPGNAFRLVTFVPDGAKETEAYVSVISAGGVRANVDRWRRDQMGLPVMTDAELQALPRAQVAGHEAVFVELEGAFRPMGGGAPKPGWMLLGMVLARDDDVVTVKMTGPADEVRPERERFRAFAESLR